MTQATPTPQATPPLNGCYYQVHEDVTNRLYQLRGTLKVLCGIAGTASVKNSTDTPEFTIEELHEMFWLLQDNFDQLINDITKTAYLFHNNERMM